MDCYKDIQKLILNLKNNNTVNKSNSLYLYGKSGIGKTTIVKEILKKNNYDYLYYDISNLKDRTTFNEIFYNDNGNINIMDYFKQETSKNIMYVIDNIDHIQNNEKIFIGNIIKAIRLRKKTKKINDSMNDKKKNIQNLSNCIIFIGSNIYEKKIKELIKISSFYEMKREETIHYKSIIKSNIVSNKVDYNLIYKFCNNNYNKIKLIQNIINKINNYEFLNKLLLQKQNNNYNENIIYCVNKLLFIPKKLKNEIYIHDNDKTVVSLLFHENIIDYLSQPNDYTFYKNFLNNICNGDYYDRICFQKQIWIINEMTYYLKIDKNYEEYNKLVEANNFLSYLNNKNKSDNYDEIYKSYIKTSNEKNKNINYEKLLKTPSRFTKVLTKYSTEYNNNNFIITLCNKLQVDRKKLFNLFYSNYENEEFYNEIEEYNINKLDIKRINSIIFCE